MQVLKDKSVSIVSALVGELELKFGKLELKHYFNKRGKKVEYVSAEYKIMFFESAWRILKNKKNILSQEERFCVVYYEFQGEDYIKEIIDKELMGIQLMKLEVYNFIDYILYFTNDIVMEIFYKCRNFDDDYQSGGLYVTDNNEQEITDLENHCLFFDYSHKFLTDCTSHTTQAKKSYMI